jgi:hypothetical protein
MEILEKKIKIFISIKMTDQTDHFRLTDFPHYFADDSSIAQVFDRLFNDPSIQMIEDMDQFMIEAQYHRFCGVKRQNLYVPNNYSLLINIPYIINNHDQTVKSFQFIRGFSGRYEFKIMNYETNYTVFGISDIDGGTGVLSIKYNSRIDYQVFKDPHIRNGSDVMLLGLGLAYLLKIRKIVLGDQATVYCDYHSEYPLRLTLFKNLMGQPGFYQKFGFQLRKDLSIPFLMIRNAPMVDVFNIFGKDWIGDNVTVEEYIYSLSIMETMGEHNCDRLSHLLEDMASLKDCNQIHEELIQLCEAFREINMFLEHQEKLVNYNDYLNMIERRM